MNSLSLLLLGMLFCMSAVFPSPLRADNIAPDDRTALQGLKEARVIFDVRLAELDKLLFNLGLVKETWEGMNSQGVKPTMIVTLRGPAVRLFIREQATRELLDLLADMKKKGVRIEICSVATRVFKVDNRQLVPEVVLVGNVLTSQIAMQNKGYALITLN